MLRTTFTRIKRVCVLAFIPRILRGEIRHLPGQFEKLTISPIRNLKLTGPESDEERCRICEKCRHLIEMAFGPEKPIEDTKAERIITTMTNEPDITQELNDEKLVQMVAPQIQVKIESEDEKCARIIEQVFSRADHEEKKKLVENVPAVPLEDMQLQTTKAKGKLKEIESEELVQPVTFNVANKEKYTSPEPYCDEELLTAMRQNVDAYDNPIENTCDTNVNATTAKEAEEQLIQKLENIDDDPLVEAPRPKIEGFNISPKVLGQEPATLNFAQNVDGNNKGTSKTDNYDEVASRCLNAPNKTIDERLLKELEILGVPQPGARAAKEPILENELVQMDVLKKPRKPVKKTEIDLETREYERVPPECFKLESLHPPFAACDKCQTWTEEDIANTEKLERLVEHFERNLVSFDEIYTKTAHLLKTTCMQQSANSGNQSYTNLITGPRPPMDPNRVLIDPYDKKTIAHDTGEYDYRDLSNLLYYDYVKPEYQENPGKEIAGTEMYAETPTHIDYNNQLYPTRFRPILTQDVLRMAGQNYHQQYSPTDGQFQQYNVQNYQRFRQTNMNYYYNQQHTESGHQDEGASTLNNDVVMSIETAPLINADRRTPLHTEVEEFAHGAYPAKDRQAVSEKSTDDYPSYQSANMMHMHTPATSTTHHGHMFHQAYTSPYPYHAESSYYNAARGYNPKEEYQSRHPLTSEAMYHLKRDPTSEQVSEETYKSEYATKPTNETSESLPENEYNKPIDSPKQEDESVYLEEAENEQNPELDTKADNEIVSPMEPEVIKLELSVGPEEVKKAVCLSNETKDQHVELKPKIGLHQRVKQMREKQNEGDFSLSFLQSKGMVNSVPKQQPAEDEAPLQNMTASLDQMPKLNEINDSDVKVSLSELLRRVRERNRMELYRELSSRLLLSAQATEVDPIEGKCGKKPPPCPPPPPKCPPPDPCPPKPCPPPPPPCPKPCKPECPSPCPPPKNPCAKFNNIRDTITLLYVSDPHDISSSVADMYLCELSKEGVAAGKGLLTDSFVTCLHNYAENLIATCRVSKSENFSYQKVTDRVDLHYARDYTPWTPIPSWPIPKKEKKQPFVCPKEGCKLFPPPRSDPPCLEKPCTGFPRRTYSLVDFFTLYLAENQVYDIGE